MSIERLVVATVCALVAMSTAPSAVADPGVAEVEPVAAEAPLEGVALPPDGAVVSPPPQTTTTPDGWTLTLVARDETQVAVPR